MKKSTREAKGAPLVPITQVPECAWLKARRAREASFAQGQMPLYKGKKSQENLMLPEKPKKMENYIAHKTIPGLFIETKFSKSQKRKAAKEIVNGKVDQAIQVTTDDAIMVSKNAQTESLDPTKKIRNLKKILREVHALERKIMNGHLARPQPEQLVKLGRKEELLMQIQLLESELY